MIVKATKYNVTMMNNAHMYENFFQETLKTQTKVCNQSFSPKGTLSTNTLLVSNVIFRNKIGSVTSFLITSLTVHGPGMFLAELVVAVGSIDLVVGELDR